MSIFPQQQPINDITTSGTPVQNSPVKKVDYHAGFAVFTNGLKRNFSQSMYHNQSEDVFLEASNPSLVHSEKIGVTWGDFFDTLPVTVTNTCLTTGTGEKFCNGQGNTLQFYLNGEKTPGLLDKEITDGDRALITFGNENNAQIQLQLKEIANPKNH